MTHDRCMAAADEKILEFLRDRELAGLGDIARRLRRPISPLRVHERLRSQAEYVAPFDTDYDLYELTSLGRGYLEGDVRADLLVPVPSARRSGHVLG